MRLVLHSPDFTDGGELPVSCTADGPDVSPALAWGGVPEGTRSLALLVDDPDAPDPAKPLRTWCHWILVDLPPDSTGVAAGVGKAALPNGARMGRNDSNTLSWRGPAPPIGRHRYFFRLYALDVTLREHRDPDRTALLAAIRGPLLAEATRMGTYARPARGGR